MVVEVVVMAAVMVGWSGSCGCGTGNGSATGSGSGSSAGLGGFDSTGRISGRSSSGGGGGGNVESWMTKRIH